MPYDGPDAADLANVEALNAAYLDWLVSRGRQAARSAPGPLQEHLARLDRRGLGYLSRAPFLLLSYREHDEARWHALFDDRRSADLLTGLETPDDAATRLVDAGLAFLWQLARRNCYAARLVTGASLGWCERLADSKLVDVLDRAADERELLVPRLADNEKLWAKLLGAGVSSRRDVRIAARVSALQVVLTAPQPAAYGRLAAAACRLPGPKSRS